LTFGSIPSCPRTNERRLHHRCGQDSPREAEGEPLTPREIEVLEIVSEGLSNKQIAARLNISEHTAKFHVNSILGKLAAGTRAEAVTRGLRRGLLKV